MQIYIHTCGTNIFAHFQSKFFFRSATCQQKQMQSEIVQTRTKTNKPKRRQHKIIKKKKNNLIELKLTKNAKSKTKN